MDTKTLPVYFNKTQSLRLTLTFYEAGTTDWPSWKVAIQPLFVNRATRDLMRDYPFCATLRYDDKLPDNQTLLFDILSRCRDLNLILGRRWGYVNLFLPRTAIQETDEKNAADLANLIQMTHTELPSLSTWTRILPPERENRWFLMPYSWASYLEDIIASHREQFAHSLYTIESVDSSKSETWIKHAKFLKNFDDYHKKRLPIHYHETIENAQNLVLCAVDSQGDVKGYITCALYASSGIQQGYIHTAVLERFQLRTQTIERLDCGYDVAHILLLEGFGAGTRPFLLESLLTILKVTRAQLGVSLVTAYTQEREILSHLYENVGMTHFNPMSFYTALESEIVVRSGSFYEKVGMLYEQYKTCRPIVTSLPEEIRSLLEYGQVSESQEWLVGTQSRLDELRKNPLSLQRLKEAIDNYNTEFSKELIDIVYSMDSFLFISGGEPVKVTEEIVSELPVEDETIPEDQHSQTSYEVVETPSLEEGELRPYPPTPDIIGPSPFIEPYIEPSPDIHGSQYVPPTPVLPSEPPSPGVEEEMLIESQKARIELTPSTAELEVYTTWQRSIDQNITRHIKELKSQKRGVTTQINKKERRMEELIEMMKEL